MAGAAVAGWVVLAGWRATDDEVVAGGLAAGSAAGDEVVATDWGDMAEVSTISPVAPD
jgi:hypothetical protein